MKVTFHGKVTGNSLRHESPPPYSQVINPSPNYKEWSEITWTSDSGDLTSHIYNSFSIKRKLPLGAAVSLTIEVSEDSSWLKK